MTSYQPKGNVETTLKCLLGRSLYTTFSDSIKLSGYNVGTQFDKDTLAAEQNNCATNPYIFYDLDA